jgi:hypothetical protein
MEICNTCEHHSSNKENYKSLRVDKHCTICGCPLATKTKSLGTNCPINKWDTVLDINEDQDLLRLKLNITEDDDKEHSSGATTESN